MNTSTLLEKRPGVGSAAVSRPASPRAAGFLRFNRRVLILGAGQLAQELYRVLMARSGYSVEVVGFLEKNASRLGESLVNPKIIGSYDQVQEIAQLHQVDTIAVCLEDRRTVLPVQALLDMKVMGREVVDGNVLIEEESGRLSIDHLRPSMLIFSDGFQRCWRTLIVKRALDILIAVTGLILLLPLFVLVGILIKADSPGPILYRQVRVGIRGEPYVMWKFRSMREDAERNGAAWAAHKDPRVSRVGRWLRKWRVDEWPQLINVLRGEMSFVGPRPERPEFVRELRSSIPYYDLRQSVRPGITGWAQTRFRYGASAEDAHVKLQYDLYYVKNLSLSIDLRIMAKTVKVVLSGDGAR
jgi:sugar transferase (PEP-CTERM system associated)